MTLRTVVEGNCPSVLDLSTKARSSSMSKSVSLLSQETESKDKGQRLQVYKSWQEALIKDGGLLRRRRSVTR